ncbi:unnamed protein product [Schistocephalus solidus]|uniref:Reverse transcriptase domain-containing protein n=1 Tax=Schistocephalus solidus TaxID=70667 RepID=A0A183TMR0_SCHSO|nr:unnamed protein product [Schistocephalus solidus]
MTSVDPIWVNNVSRALTENCASRGLMGYFTIDFATFFHEESGEQLLWITGIRPGYSENLAMFQLVRMLADADFTIDAQTGDHQLLATPISKTPDFGKSNPPLVSNQLQRTSPRKVELYAVVSANLNHSCLALIQYPVLLRICRALGIGFSLQEKEGSAFTLFNELKHEKLGMM